MCGIGLICGSDSKIKNKMADIINSNQRSRGPDNIEKQNFKQITLCHQRLRIVGLDSKFNQPYKWKNFVIVFNGEIYNYLELASKFSLSESAFRNDTACLIELFDSVGIKRALDFIDGMYCFAIFDIKKNLITVCTDPFGIKQLYTTIIKKHLVITSTVEAAKQCLINEGIKLNLDPITKRWQECFNGSPPGHTHLKEIRQLENNSFYQINLNKKEIKLEKILFSKSYNQNIKNKEINESVIEEALFGEVPSAIMLSGGIDSTCLLSKSKSLNIELKAFILNNKFDKQSGFSVNEVENAKKYSKSLNIDSIIVDSQGVTKSDLENLFSMIDTPSEVTGALGLLKICKEINKNHKKIKYIISGLGADEIYFGYRSHLLTLIFSFLPNFMINIFQFTNPFLEYLIYNSKFYLKRRLSHFKRFLNANSKFQDAVLHTQENLSKKCALLWRSYYPNNKSNSLLFKKFYDSCFNFFLPQLHLIPSDRISMYYSLELRLPFLQSRILRNKRIHNNFFSALKVLREKKDLRLIIKKYLPIRYQRIKKSGFGVDNPQLYNLSALNYINDLLEKGNKSKLIKTDNFVSKETPIKKFIFLINKAHYVFLSENKNL